MPSPTPLTLRLGARGSLLSRLQSTLVARALEAAHPGLRIELVIIATSGDVIQDRPLHEFGGKGLFTKELEQALLRREIDFAVHSFKDIPVTMPLVDIAELVIAAVPQREDPRDVLAVKPGVCHAPRRAEALASDSGTELPLSMAAEGFGLLDLPHGANVGTGSLRRQAQVLALRPDLTVLPIRGNIDTRLRKLQAGDYDAVILAAAGLKRASLYDVTFMTPLPMDQMLPAAGQGALALQCRHDNATVREILGMLNHPDTAHAVGTERDVVRLLNGDCHSPIAALAERRGNNITLHAAVAARDGKPPIIHAGASYLHEKQADISRAVVSALLAKGADKLLAGTCDSIPPTP